MCSSDLGEVNPADLFAKHSLSRDRLGALVELFDCKSQGGRAESAPNTRQAPSSKKTMAAHEQAPDEVMLAQGENKPIMPHRSYSPAELDHRHPTIQVHDTEYDCDDMVKDQDDTTLQAGLKIAEGIWQDAEEHGRRRIEKGQ